MFKTFGMEIAITLYHMPFRAWQYGQRCPLEAIVYGVTLAAVSLFSKLFLALLAFIAVASGIKAALRVVP